MCAQYAACAYSPYAPYIHTLHSAHTHAHAHTHCSQELYTQHGLGLSLLRRMYSGFASAALFSVAVGAVHWLSFCAAKRSAMEWLPKLANNSPALKSSMSAAAGKVGAGRWRTGLVYA